LKKLIEASEFRDRIELIQTRLDAAEFLSSLDLFVSMSRSEAFGLAIVEAMACGVPVIATETEGAREIVQAGESGTLVPIDNAKRTATAITELLRDDSRRKRFAANAGRYVAERFSLPRMVAETEAVYDRVRGLA
jgi:glycosyltransferase involved in cell wall biosynthesis